MTARVSRNLSGGAVQASRAHLVGRAQPISRYSWYPATVA